MRVESREAGQNSYTLAWTSSYFHDANQVHEHRTWFETRDDLPADTSTTGSVTVGRSTTSRYEKTNDYDRFKVGRVKLQERQRLVRSDPRGGQDLRDHAVGARRTG